MYTEREYKIFQRAYDFFNERLFSAQPLPQVLITFQRKHKTYGYFSSRGFTRRKGVQFPEERIGEIAMNPDWFVGHSDLAILQTFVHEMCHVWQWAHGKQSRGGYHNQEWGDKMQEIGLMPSSTGKPGGKKTGQSMGDYIIEGGAFHRYAEEFLLDTENAIGWQSMDIRVVKELYQNPPITTPLPLTAQGDPTSDEISTLQEEPDIDGLETLLSDYKADSVEEAIIKQENSQSGKRYRYSCPSCLTKVWGKADLNLVCGNCEVPFFCG